AEIEVTVGVPAAAHEDEAELLPAPVTSSEVADQGRAILCLTAGACTRLAGRVPLEAGRSGVAIVIILGPKGVKPGTSAGVESADETCDELMRLWHCAATSGVARDEYVTRCLDRLRRSCRSHAGQRRGDGARSQTGKPHLSPRPRVARTRCVALSRS